MSGAADEALPRAVELPVRVTAARPVPARRAAEDDAEGAVAVLGELADLAKEVEAELSRARANAGA